MTGAGGGSRVVGDRTNHKEQRGDARVACKQSVANSFTRPFAATSSPASMIENTCLSLSAWLATRKPLLLPPLLPQCTPIASSRADTLPLRLALLVQHVHQPHPRPGDGRTCHLQTEVRTASSATALAWVTGTPPAPSAASASPLRPASMAAPRLGLPRCQPVTSYRLLAHLSDVGVPVEQPRVSGRVDERVAAAQRRRDRACDRVMTPTDNNTGSWSDRQPSSHPHRHRKVGGEDYGAVSGPDQGSGVACHHRVQHDADKQLACLGARPVVRAASSSSPLPMQ